MFELKTEVSPQTGQKTYLAVDESRNVSLERIEGQGYGAEDDFVLTWDERKIEFTTWRQPGETVDGEGFLLIGFHDFGPGLAPGDERDVAQLFAAEGLLAVGWSRHGLDLDEGVVRVQVDEGPEAGTYTLASFGYRNAA